MGLSHRQAGQLYQAAVGRSKELQTRRLGSRCFVTPENLLRYAASQVKARTIANIESPQFSRAMLMIQEAEPEDLRAF